MRTVIFSSFQGWTNSSRYYSPRLLFRGTGYFLKYSVPLFFWSLYPPKALLVTINFNFRGNWVRIPRYPLDPPPLSRPLSLWWIMGFRKYPWWKSNRLHFFWPVYFFCFAMDSSRYKPRGKCKSNPAFRWKPDSGKNNCVYEWCL